MLSTAYNKKRKSYRKCYREFGTHDLKKVFLLLTIFIITSVVSAQTVSLSLKNASLQKAFKEIEALIPQRFVYTTEMVQQSRPVNIRVQNASLPTVLEMVFKDQPLDFNLDDHFIKVCFKTSTAVTPDWIEIRGRVTGEEGEPLPNVSVSAKRSNAFTVTDAGGGFFLNKLSPGDELGFSSIGYNGKTVVLNGTPFLNVRLSLAVSELDRALVIAYGTTSQRFNTGNVAKLSAREIEKQPVSNPLAALQGRVAGLLITQTSGVTGSAFNVELRGRTSLDLGLSKNDPLFIIDGVPFEQGNQPSNQLTSAVANPRQINEGGISPLNTLNPADIESIEVLKDADATAIYGSRGANGVILITTKKGKSGKTKLSAQFYTGFSKITRMMDLLNTQQYVALRREAFANDGIIPNATNAPDIILWDTTRYTDLKKLLIGNTAGSSDAQLSLSGGTPLTQFLVSGGYHYETNVFSRAMADKKGTARFNLSHQSTNGNLKITFGASYANDKNELVRSDLTSYLNLPPNVRLYDSLGNLSWSEKGVNLPTINPLAAFEKKYTSVNENLVASWALSWQVHKNIAARINGGYNRFSSDETGIDPKTSIAPSSATLASSQFANSKSKSWIIEPQLQYKRGWKKQKLDLLLGSTMQERITGSQFINATNYTNDLLLYSIAAAGNVTASNNYSQYRYAAFFGRINYNRKDRYLLNLSGRRDGSTKFGPGKRFASFGAVGAAWIFSNETWVKKKAAWLSFGKLRGSYGITGNDQIGDYKYLDLWSNTSFTYGGVPGFRPSSLFNPDYNWERNKKLEFGLDLGLFRERVALSAAFYRNRSNNQLISYKLSSQTGFGSVNQNLPALVQNKGLEFIVTTKNISGKNWVWTTTANITMPKNKLLAFPGLLASSYGTTFVLGQPLSILNKLKYLGVDPATGVYTFEDVNKDGSFTGADYRPVKNLDPSYYGGILNTISYKSIELTCFFEFKKQLGRNYLYQQRSFYPGSANNQPVLVLDRWQKPGDVTEIQKYTTVSGSLAGGMGSVLLGASDGVFSDASFVRLKNVSLNVQLPASLTKRLHMDAANLYLRAQNLVTITGYKGSDPETQNFYQLPPLKTIALGLNLNF